jgi:PleD family two-component response regulator
MSYGRSQPYDVGALAQRGDVPAALAAQVHRELVTLRLVNAGLFREVAMLRRREAAGLKLADQDALTGLYNRRSLESLQKASLHAATQHGVPVGLSLQPVLRPGRS